MSSNPKRHISEVNDENKSKRSRKDSESDCSTEGISQGVEGWMNKTYQYHVNEERHSEVSNFLTEHAEYCRRRFHDVEGLMLKLDDRMKKIDNKLNKIWKKLQELNDEKDDESMSNTEVNSDGSRCY